MSVFCNLCSPPTRHEDDAIAEHMLTVHDFDFAAAVRAAPPLPGRLRRLLVALCVELGRYRSGRC